MIETNLKINEDMKIYNIKTHKPNFGPVDKQWLFRFPNDYGASVVINDCSYGHENGLFELAVIKYQDNEWEEEWEIDYSTPITNDVLGYLRSKDVMEYLYQIKNLNDIEGGRLNGISYIKS